MESTLAHSTVNRIAVLIAVALTLAAVTPVTSMIEDEEPITCLDGQERCRRDMHCRSLLGHIPDVCDRSAETCHSLQYELCFNILSTLQRSAHFRGCLCDMQEQHGLHECDDLKRIIYHHACLYKVLSRNSSYSVPTQSASLLRTHDDQPPVTQRDEAVIRHRPAHNGPPVEHFESCIGVRKRCLMDFDCDKQLEAFREYCRESKKQSRCVTDQREECFHAIKYLEGSGLFGCRCSHIQKPDPREKCDRIQYRVANNTCLVDVPYFIYSTGLYDNGQTGSGARVDLALGDQVTEAKDFESTCVQAYEKCHLDPACRLRTANFQNSCLWNRISSTCDKSSCLRALQEFFLYVRPEIAHAQLFCRCRPGDKNCESAKRKLYPVCTVVDHPAPSCVDILDSCQKDDDCKVRFKALESNCGYYKKDGECPSGGAMCRNALAGIMGTVLTTNCTCETARDQVERQQCENARNRIQHQNSCKGMARDEFHKLQQHKQRALQDNAHKADQDLPSERHDCQRQLGRYFPSFMRAPSVIRRYHNDSECSDICQCRLNGTLACTGLPCKANLVCRVAGHTYQHGATFVRKEPEGGECRCIKGEVVCATSPRIPLSEAGLFLHVGYSMSDMYLVEGHSNVVFRPKTVAQKLGAILNEDSAGQFCTLTLHAHLDGNLIFNVKLSELSPKLRKGECDIRTKELSDKINWRNPIIVDDAELSILKISELENITIHQPPRREELFVGSRTGHASHCDRSSSALVLFLACSVLAWTRR